MDEVRSIVLSGREQRVWLALLQATLPPGRILDVPLEPESRFALME